MNGKIVFLFFMFFWAIIPLDLRATAPPTPRLPQNPQNFQMTVGPRRISLTWTKNTDSTYFYNIYRKTGSGSYTLIDTSFDGKYIDTNAQAGIQYEYSVEAIDTIGQSSGLASSISGKSNRIWYVSKSGIDQLINGFSASPFASLGYALQRVKDGDTVVVAEGRYFESIDARGKGFVLASEYLLDGDTTHISRTMLDGSKQNRVLYVGAGAGKPVFLKGITIQHGNESVGAGVRFEGSNLLVDRCLFLSNKAIGDVNGAGIYFNGAGRITNTDFRDHHARKGSSLMMGPTADSIILIDGCNFIRDTATECGSVMIYMGSGKVIVRNSLVTENFGNSFWLQSMEADLQLVNTTIADNKNNGSTIIGWIGKLSVENSIFYNNGNYLAVDTTQFASFRRDNPTYKFSLKLRNSLFDKGNYNDSGVIIGNPIFAKSNRNAGIPSDYALSNNSPVLGRGLLKYSAGFDLLGQVRSQPTGSAPDYGAIENSLQNYLDSFHARGGYKRSVLTWNLLPNNRNDLKIVVLKDSISGMGVFKPIDTLAVNERYVDSLLGGKTTNTYFIKIIDNSGNLIQLSDTQTVNTTSNLFVSNTGRNDNPGSFKYPLKTITYALSKAQKRDTVFVLAGTYSDNLNLNTDSIMILGVDGFKNTILQPADANQQLFNLFVKGILAQGITFRNAKNCTQTSNQGSSSVFVNCRFTNNGTSGTSVFQQNQGAIKYINCLFDRNNGGFNFTNNDTADGGSYFNYCTFINNASFSNSFTTGSNNAKVAILNSILWDTRKDSVIGLSIGNPDLYIENSLVKDAIWSLSNSNFNYEPVFIDTTLYYISNKSLANNYGLDSIYLGYGDYIGNIGFDITGKQRPIPLSTKPDIGSYENGHGSQIIDNLTVTPGFRRVILGVDLLDSTELTHGRLTIRAYTYDSSQKKSVFVDSINKNKLPSVWVIKNIKPASIMGFYLEVIDDLGYKIEYSDTIYTVTDSTVYLSPNGTDASLGTKNSPLLTINTAIQDAGQRDTIYLLAGHYNQSFETKGYVQVLGVEGYQKTSISSISNTDGCVNLRGPGSLVEGLTIKNSRYGVVCHNFTHARMNSCRITRCGKINDWSFAIRGHDGTGLFTNLIVDSNLNNAVSFDYKHNYGYRFYNCNFINNESFGGTSTSGPGKVWFVNSILWTDLRDSLNVAWNDGYSIHHSSVKSNYQASKNSNVNFKPYFKAYAKLADTSSLLGLGTDSLIFNGIKSTVLIGTDFFGGKRPLPLKSMPDIGAFESPYLFTAPQIDSINYLLDTFNVFVKFHRANNKNLIHLEVWDSTATNIIKVLKDSLHLGVNRYVFSEWSLMNGVKYLVRTTIEDSLSDFSPFDTLMVPVNSWNCRGLTASIKVNDSVQCLTGNSFNFISNSKDTANYSLEHYWNFGNSQLSRDSLKSISYSSPKTYKVSLSVKNEKGCVRKDSMEVTAIKVLPKITTNSFAQCEIGNQFVFHDSSKILPLNYSSISNRQWKIRNIIQSSSNASISYNFAQDSLSYRVSLQMSESNGCSSDTQIFVNVYPNTKVSVKYLTDTVVCNYGASRNTVKFGKNILVDKQGNGNSTIFKSYWKFNGNSYNSDTLFLSETVSKKYSFKLFTETTDGCKDSSLGSFSLYSIPLVKYSVDDSTQCFDTHKYKFTNSSQHFSSSIQYTWDFGDSSSSSAFNAVKVYSYTGRKSVSLIGVDSRGCADSFRQDVYVAPYPVSNFTINDSVQCENHNLYVFEDASSILSGGGSLSSQWIYGDNGTASGDSVAHNYATKTGYIKVQHKSISSYGCRDSSIQTVHVRKGPDAVIGLDTVLYCNRGNEFGATDLSVKGEGNKTKFTWTWGDGIVDVKSTPSRFTHSYANTGTYNIKLLVEDQYSCIDSISKSTTVHPNPTAQFAIVDSLQCFNANSFSFVQQSTSNTTNSTLSYAWTFGDGGTSAVASPTHSYSSFGSRDLQLQVENVFGCKDTFDSKARVYALPEVMFTVNDSTQCENNQLFNYQDLSSISSGEGSISRNWTLGDGNQSTASSFSYKYSGHDTVFVKLVQTSSFGCKDSLSKRIEILRKPQIRFAKIGADSCRNTTSKFKAWDADVAKPLNVNWLFSDNQTFNDSIITASFAVEGQKSLRVIVGNNKGCADTINRIFNVYENPHAGFFITDSALCFRGNEFEYNDTTSINHGTVSQLIWDFGDGKSQTKTTNAAVYNRYSDTGNYTVKLRVTNSMGCGDTITRKLRVLPQPKAIFTHADSLQCRTNNSFAFNNLSVSNSPTTSLTYDWRFGDSTTSASVNPVKSYVYDGVKNLTLYVENGEGCRDTFTSKLEVYPQSVVNFAINDVDQCENHNLFQFTGNSTTGARGGYLYSKWIFGDGATDTSRNTSHRYTAHANHQVKLVVTTFYGCKDSLSKGVTVFKKPTGVYTKITKDSCLNNTHTFKVDDLDAATMTSVLWDFQDGNTYNDSIITRSFASDGQKSVLLYIQNSDGCIDSMYPKFRIYDNPIANFTRKDTFLCLEGNNFELKSTATTKYGSINQNKWEFGDGQTGASKDFNHSYTDSGYYNITYRVVNTLGCGDSITKLVRVNPNPRVHFNADLYQQCWHSNLTQFTDSSESNLKGKSNLIYAWNFGDSLTSASANPQKTYQWYGVKTVQLIATNDEGCSDTIKRSVEIRPEPIAKFKIDNAAQCVNDNKFNFLDTTLTRQRGGSHLVSWKFSDGDTSNLKSFSRTKNQVGTMVLKMIATSEFGCQDSIEKSIRLFAKPQAVVKYLSQDSCLSTTAKFQAVNAALNGIRTATWSFDDGTGSTGINASKKYSNTGTKTVLLNLENTNYCRDTVEFQYAVRSNPKSYFVASKYSLCERGNLVVFKDSSSAVEGQIDSLVWDFNNGVRLGKTGKDTAQYSFAVARTYTVKQLAVNSFGCQDSSTQKVTILANPDADFDVDQSSQCLAGNSYTLTNNTNPNNGNSAMNFFWSFGDTTNSSMRNPKKSYSYDGSKKIRLIASNSDGCLDTIDKTVLVRPQPKAKFAVNTQNQCVNAQSYTFTDQSSVKTGGGSLSRVWSLGDGTVSNQSTVTGVKYNAAGIYTVKLTSRTTFNCIDTVIQQIRVYPKPTVSYTINQDTQCLVGNTYSFNNTSNIATGGGTLIYSWTFGNGASSNNTHPTLSYGQYGTYNVELKATSSNGCVEILKKNVTVVANPSVNFAFSSADKQCNSVNAFKMTNQTNLLNARSAKYTWNYGDNTISTSVNGTRSYSQAGNYTVKLLAVNSSGCTDSISKSLTVYPDPVADFSINQSGQCINNQLFDFKNNSSIAFGGGTLSQVWKASDSLISTSQNLNATFNEVKSYAIKLLSISSLGCQDSISKNIVVYPKPKADFAINNSQQCLQNNKFEYTNNSKISSGTLNYVWSYGDATGSTAVSPSKNYSAFGNYTVKLVTLSGFGCKDSILKTIKVHSQPLVQFSLSDTTSCLYQNQFTFTNQSSNADGSSMSHTWIYSDATSQSALNSVKSFSNSGRYLVKLRSQTSFGCRDSLVRSVRIYPQPLPSFSVVKANQCLNNNVFEVQNASSIATEGGTLSYVWDFGDGNSSTTKNPKWSFVKSDTYTISMMVKSSFNCIDSLKKVAVVHPEPSVDFNFVKSGVQTGADTIQCLNTNIFQLNNLSTVSSGSLSHQWSFGNGQNSLGLNPQIKYNADGKYRIRLISTTTFGCRDSSFETVSVYPDPEADFSINDVDQCFRGHEFVFTNNSNIKSGTMSYQWSVEDGTLATTQNLVKKFNEFGNYSVTLKTRSTKGCEDSATKMVRVYAQPRASFVTNDSIQCFNNNDYIFENKSSIGFGSLVSLWSFGDANFSSSQLGRHEYKKAGAYQVRLISSSAFGCADTAINSVKVTEIPKISFTMNSSAMCERGNYFVADNSSTYNGSETVTYIWKITDGFVDSAAYFNYSFSNAGKFGIKLIGITSEGCADSASKSVTVYPQGVSNVRILDTIQCLYGNDFSFGNDSKVTGAAFSIMSWNFGDGIIDTAYRTEPISHSYNDTGLYQVELITTTEHLCTDNSIGFVRVVPMPQAKLSLNQYGYCFNEQQFELIDISDKQFGFKNRWIYGNSESDLLDTLRPVFDRVGKYRVRLVEYTQFGCTDTAESQLVVNKIPIARIAVNINEQCLEKNEFLFRNVSIDADEPMEFWDFGDGAFGSGNEVIQTYADAGNFEVILVVENDSNCLDTAMLSVRVNPTPEASLLIDPSCQGTLVNISTGASIADGFINQYEWNMGDGRNYFFEQPQHIYSKPGKYYITLAMTSDQGCYAKFLDSTNVYENPTAHIAAFTQRATILKPQVYFLDSSINSASYEWDFGDGTDLVYDFEAYHEYSDTGIYTARLVVASADGCYDTTYANVRVWPDFNILLPTAFSPNGDMSNDVYRIRGNHHSIQIAEWQIYTDDGIRVFESMNITDSWDGTYKGQPLPMGNYQLVLIVKDVFGKQAQFNEKISLVR